LIDSKLGILIVVVFGIAEILEKFGLAKKYAHLITLPLGILGSFVFLQCSSTSEYIVYGLFSGIAATGTCDTICNVVSNLKNHNDEE